MDNYKIHNDFQKYSKMSIPLSPAKLPLMNMLMSVMVKTVKRPDDITERKQKIEGYKGGAINVTIIQSDNADSNIPCLVYFHGGAFAVKAAAHHKDLAYRYAKGASCKVVFVEYRLAPKYPFPYGVEDCYASFIWAYENANALGIDKNRIAVGGDSAGGAIAAAVCLMARDRNSPPICFQMLVYPVTDERQTSESIKKYTDTPLWNSGLNREMWELYLRDGTGEHKEYASPMEAPSHANLPNAYVETAEFDCLCDEGIAYAEALKNAGAQIELNKTAGTIHGYEVAMKSEITTENVARRINALRKAFGL